MYIIVFRVNPYLLSTNIFLVHLYTQVMDATFDHILPLAQSKMPSFGAKHFLVTANGFYIFAGNIVEMVIKNCMNLNVAEQLC